MHKLNSFWSHNFQGGHKVIPQPGRHFRLVPSALASRHIVDVDRQRPPTEHIMTKHSKNNTASSIFSYAERKKLEYGTKGVRSLACLDSALTITATPINLCSNVSAMNRCEDLVHVPCVCSEHAIRWPVKKGICFARNAHIRISVSSETVISPFSVLSDSFSGAKEGHKAAEGATRSS
jgi:hypothetical protein